MFLDRHIHPAAGTMFLSVFNVSRFTKDFFFWSLISAVALAPQVGLWKSHSKHGAEEGCFVAHQKPSVHHTMSTNTNIKSLQNIINKIELLQTSRDRQVAEAMLCNHRLQQELWSSKETVAALEECNSALKREQVSMRRKVEEARQALLNGLGKVKELEAKTNCVPLLQRKILQLESELLYYRYVFDPQEEITAFI